MSFFKPKVDIRDNTQPFDKAQSGGRKVILMLFDALREDFVEFDSETHTYLDSEAAYAYKGQKVQLFKNLKEENPDNAILLPCYAEFPTITKSRVKSLLSGSLSTFFSISDEFIDKEVQEDNILWQLKHKKYKKGDSQDIVFYGDYIWDILYGSWWDRHKSYSSQDMNDLDTLDDKTKKDIFKELDDGSNFALMVTHLIGADSAGHVFNSQHSELERKLLDTE